jgi:hypothetical protein
MRTELQVMKGDIQRLRQSVTILRYVAIVQAMTIIALAVAVTAQAVK